MAEATQFAFTLKEAVTALIKAQGLHEGKWTLIVSFAFAAMNIGNTKEDAAPAAIASVSSLGLQRAVEDSPWFVDAAEVNPAMTKK